MKLPKDRKGFSLVEVLLLIMTLTLVMGVGYYIYDRNQDNSQTFNTEDSSGVETSLEQGDKTATTEIEQRISENWYLYENDEYSVRIPDGWVLHPLGDGLIGMYDSLPISKMVFEKGVPGRVAERIDAGFDGWTFELILMDSVNYGNGLSYEGEYAELGCYENSDIMSYNSSFTISSVYCTKSRALGYGYSEIQSSLYSFKGGHLLLIEKLNDEPSYLEARSYAEEMLRTLEIK